MRESRLIEILKLCGVSQQQMADRLGIAKTSVSAWAHGTRPMPHKHELVLLAWAKEAEQAALEEARARDAVRPTPASLLGGDDWEERKFRTDVQRLWSDYDWADSDKMVGELAVAIIRMLQEPVRLCVPSHTTDLTHAETVWLKSWNSRLTSLLNKYLRLLDMLDREDAA